MLNIGSDLEMLKHFSPVLLSSEYQLDKVVLTDIQAHLQKHGQLSVYSDFSLLGVRLSYFDNFIQRFGGRQVFNGLTTKAVMEQFVFEATKESKLSFCEQLQLEGFSESVGTAEVFYSHAWKYLFLDVVDSAKLHFSDSDQDPVIWFDVFSVSQHKAQLRPFEWWNSAFLNAIGVIGKVLMLIQPFESTVSMADGTLENLPAWTTLT